MAGMIEEIRISGFTSLGIIKDERIERRLCALCANR
jgi:hypothetical protein